MSSIQASTLFVSDLHLDPDHPAILDAFRRFLHDHIDCAALYILGDLFETWLGDDDDSTLAQQTTGLLRGFSQQGPALYLMQGNRDFLLGDSFARQCGATLLCDPTVIDLYGEQTLLTHGDTLCTADLDYQAFRRTVHNPQWQADVLALSLEERRQLALRMRLESTAASSNKPEDIMDASPEAADRLMAEHGASLLIHGHTHRPAEHRQTHGRRWVLGDWAEQGWAIEARSGQIDYINIVI